MNPISVSAAQARRFLVQRHLLSPPRSLPAAPESVLAAIERLGSFQFDPLETPGARNHDLVLHARIAGYDRAWCDLWLYGPADERRLFEAYNKSLNILPLSELPYYRIAWHRAEERYKDRIMKQRGEAARAILERLRVEGPLSTAAVSKDMGGRVDWHWAPTAEGRALLEALFEMGLVGIARRDKSRRTFDRIERLFPEDVLAQRVSHAESVRHRLLSRFRGVGLMGTSGGSPELVLGTAPASERASMTEAMVDDGTLVPVEVEGLRGLRYALREELPMLEAAGRPRPARSSASAGGAIRSASAGGAIRSARARPGVALLAPLDPLLWDRRLVRELFSFDYIWEVYVPEAKRRHGYYVLPILFGDRLVGRIEPRLDRAAGALRIIGLWFEEGFDPLGEPGFVGALAEALRAYRRFVGAVKTTFPRSKLSAEVGRAVRRAEEDEAARGR
jgi:uncharacterized protein YcaQ